MPNLQVTVKECTVETRSDLLQIITVKFIITRECAYEVWQKRIETDLNLPKFLFFSIMNVIPFKIVPLATTHRWRRFSHFW